MIKGLVDDEGQWHKFKEDVKDIHHKKFKETQNVRVMEHVNNELRQVEEMFNIEEGFNQPGGAFVNRHLNIAPYYNDYKSEKLKIIGLLQKKNTLDASIRQKFIQNEKQRQSEYYLKKWDLYRQEQINREDARVAHLRSEKKFKFWIASALCDKICRTCYSNF